MRASSLHGGCPSPFTMQPSKLRVEGVHGNKPMKVGGQAGQKGGTRDANNRCLVISYSGYQDVSRRSKYKMAYILF